MERTPYFALEVQLAFLRNSITAELFMAPAIGANAAEAEANLRETYPSAVYNLMAIYPAAAVQRYLADLQRWPGLPSKTQPSLTDLLASQRIRAQTGGLPPLHRKPAQPAQTYPAGLNAAQVAQLQTIAKGMPTETRELAARLMGANATQSSVQAEPIPQSANPFVPEMAPQPEAKLHPFAPRPATPRANPVPQGSLKDALAALRSMNGVGATVQQTATPISRTPPPIANAFAQPAETAAPKLSPSALPPSARGTMQDDTMPAPSAFAVGKVSAISVLKALRQRQA